MQIIWNLIKLVGYELALQGQKNITLSGHLLIQPV